MIRSLLLFLFLVPSILIAQNGTNLTYDTVPGDPLKARIYTLENGLKVYLTVYKDEPRFQSMIAIKAGSKHDPADATGLAHYLEHMLFKGTDKYGSLDYSKEAPLLDTIFNLYERYGQTKDSAMRAKIYQQIDSVSGIAASYAIPNEFDKMMAGLGITGVNAYTSNEQTVYINNVPSNQIYNFFNIEAERFRNPQMRLFHTELEAVYEEKNRALDSDGRKQWEALMSGIFPNHQYGTQTTIGTIEHLKNPSLKSIKKFLDTYYVPNNMVIALSGDFDPDEAIKIINEKFGSMAPKPVPAFKVPTENLIKQPVVKEVYGPDAESLLMGYRFGGASSRDADLAMMVDMILSNGQAGLLDLNLNNSQKVLSSSSSFMMLKDYSVHMLEGRPREGQSLHEVRDLLLGQIKEIKEGNFPDWLIPAIVTNMKADQLASFTSNSARARTMLSADINGIDYKSVVERIDRLAKISKPELVQFVRDWYGDNYVAVYKLTGEDPSIVKVVKPQITAVKTNSEEQSPFVKEILSAEVKPVEPVFINFEEAIKIAKLNSGVPVYITKNTDNKLFELRYVWDMGTNNNPKLGMILEYLNYASTPKYTSAQVKEEFYKLGCSFSNWTSEEESGVSISGIVENFDKSVILMEEVLSNIKSDPSVLQNLIADVLKSRADAKLNKNIILAYMQSYGKYGAENPSTNILSEEELKKLSADEIASAIRNLSGFRHRIDYYGPAEHATVVTALNKFHKTPRELKEAPAPKVFTEKETSNPQVYVVNYDMKQAEIIFLSKGLKYDPKQVPVITMYNRYFGGGMSSPVFQTMRESKALAYAVSSRYSQPDRKDRSYYNYAYIGTQADKLPEAMSGMMELLTEFPMSEKGYAQAKEGALQQIRSDRLTRIEVLDTYHRYRKMGITHDLRKDIFTTIPTYSLTDIKSFQEQNLKNQKYTVLVLGNKDNLDMKALEKYGPVKFLELKDIFGY